jgi:tRNA A37 methylthiotransferase MiaB
MPPDEAGTLVEDLEDIGGAETSDGIRVTRDLPPIVATRRRATAESGSRGVRRGGGLGACAATNAAIGDVPPDRLEDVDVDDDEDEPYEPEPDDDDDFALARPNAASVVPGRAKVHVRTFGCSHNISDSEFMAGQLSAYGYTLTTSPEDADLWVVNTCTVKNPSQSAMNTVIERGKAAGKKLVIAGCGACCTLVPIRPRRRGERRSLRTFPCASLRPGSLAFNPDTPRRLSTPLLTPLNSTPTFAVPQGDKNARELDDLTLLGVTQIDRVVEAVERTLAGDAVRMLAKKTLPALDLPKIRRNEHVEIVPLSTGCLGKCTYCKTKHARGELGSYAPEALVARVQTAIAEGVTEIWLSSEDTGAYGIDLGTDVTRLLRDVTAALPKDGSCMLRLGMTNPPYILAHLDAVAEAMHHPGVYAFLHIPVQAGSDAVLGRMKREYVVADFEKGAFYEYKSFSPIVRFQHLIAPRFN